MKLDPITETGRVRTLRATCASGAATTVHVAAWELDRVRVAVHLLQPPRRVLDWSKDAGGVDAMNGGFFTKPAREPLGELHLDGARRSVRPFVDPWCSTRGALYVADGAPQVGPWDELARLQLHAPGTHVMQAGPLLVRGAASVVATDDPEGFSSTHELEFDSDITAERLPRMGIAVAPGTLLAIAVDGRSDEDSGLLLPEFADLLVELGARDALNLDGGSSSSLVVDGTLHNHPRDDDGNEFDCGYPTTTVISFATV